MAAAIYAVAAAFRLARFNLIKASETGGKSYAGIPVPAAAFILLAATFLPFQGWVVALVALLVAILMVSTVKVPKW